MILAASPPLWLLEIGAFVFACLTGYFGAQWYYLRGEALMWRGLYEELANKKDPPLHIKPSDKMLRHTGHGDTAENRLHRTQYLVEATSFESHTLWSKWCECSPWCEEPLIKEWRQLGGWTVVVGYINKLPVTVSLSFDLLDGFMVCHWEAVSRVVDYEMISEWFDKHYKAKTIDGRAARCDAMNYHHCTLELKRWKEQQNQENREDENHP